ncbi:MAG: DNA (cytosine-5-)-methyltransferase [Xenococcaceae cyanobacterium]
MGKTKLAIEEKVTVQEAARILDVSPDTIRRWEKKKLIRAKRSENNYRLFELEELRRIQNKYLGHETSVEFQVLKSRKTKFNVIELFSGCGGMALGFENAGLTTKLLVEIDKNCVDTLQINQPRWKIEHQDIADVDFTSYKGKVDIVAGGPPCQAFSYAGLSKGFEDTRGTLFFQFTRCVKEVQPKIALVENVRGLIRHDQGRTLSTMLQALSDLGYEPVYRLLRAQFLDVPQKRERVVIIGVREDLDIPAIFPKEKDYTVSIREALKNCPKSIGAEYPKRKREILELVPPGGYWRDLPIELQKEYMKKSFYLGGGKTGMARRLSWDEPSLTLTCSPAQKQTERCHPEETRPLTVREYARIQGFPDDWQFTGSLASQYRQIGNAVPVNLAYHIGRCLIAMLKNEFDEERMVLGINQK